MGTRWKSMKKSNCFARPPPPPYPLNWRKWPPQAKILYILSEISPLQAKICNFLKEHKKDLKNGVDAQMR